MSDETKRKLKVVLFATHPQASNGYSAICYRLAKEISKRDDIALTIFGFQHYYTIENHRTDFPANVSIYDAFAHENPKSNGFGLDLVDAFMKEHRPDVCGIYNDSTIVSAFMTKIRASEVPTKIFLYYDQVTPYQKKQYIDIINKMADKVITFTPYWEKVVKELGCTVPTDFLCHGVDSDIYYPVPKDIARRYFGVNPNDFIVVNTNRNQPRKRWDIVMKAFAEVVSRLPDAPIKLLIGTAVTGAWNLFEIFERECKKRNIPKDIGMRRLIVVDNGQRLSDFANNLLLNCGDIGINACEGAGFELVQVEMGLCGKPQVIPNIGGLQESFDESCSYVIEPTMAYYIDSSRDSVGGEAFVCDYVDYADGIIHYYEHRDELEKHGKILRDRFLRKYRWKDIGNKFYNQIISLVPEWVQQQKQLTDEVKDLAEQVEKIDIATIKKLVTNVKDEQKDEASPSPPSIVEKSTKKQKVKNASFELAKLRQQIDDILSTLDDEEDNE